MLQDNLILAHLYHLNQITGDTSILLQTLVLLYTVHSSMQEGYQIDLSPNASF